MRRRPEWEVRAAEGAAVIGVLLASWSFWQAVELETFPDALPRVDARAATSLSRAGYPLRTVLAGTERDPFRPDRSRAPERFRLPTSAYSTAPSRKRLRQRRSKRSR